MAEIVSAEKAAEMIPDDAVVGVAGMGLSGWPEEVACAIRDRFAKTGHPQNLNLKQNSAMGDWGFGNQFYGWEKNKREEPLENEGARGVTRFGEAGTGLIKRWTSAHIGSAFSLNSLARKNLIDAHCIPQGVAINLWREIAAGRPGLLTKVGLGTFVDPRLEGGRMNEYEDPEEVVRYVNFEGEDYLFYPAFSCDVALLRGTIADENGNISFEKESVMNEGFSVATATKNSGGIVIVQVEYLAKKESLNPKDVKIPGNLVDYVVVASDPMASWQAEGTYFQPAFSGHIRVPLEKIKPMELDERKVICRRCAMELKKGNLINLGVGMPASIASVVAEEGLLDEVTMSTESGMVGGMPSALPNFGSAYNPESILTPGDMFDLINGGGLDVTCLGIGEVDQYGNNNVSKMGTRLTGPGGFIDITTSTKTVIFAGTLMGKAKLQIKDGEIKVLEEGTIKKFVKDVDQITFSAKYSPESQKVMYVTERAVFELKNGELVLVEIAPGLDLEKDVLQCMDFQPKIGPNLKTMDERLFCETWGELDRFIEK
ncbi:MAG: acyl CoA:acetate/3-ketoacid CoA transferase [Lachnospiraceae bacterium]|nr:acyl CoA:acetate/3-ketoacid CoA transferase [Lachnospiraceae bacterium]